MMRIEDIRRDTPHCQDKIFLNSAGASLMPRTVVETVHAYLLEEERRGGYGAADTRQDEIRQFYHAAAHLINCAPGNIAFTHDATDAYTRALSSIPFQPGDVILTTDDDYASSFIAFASLQKRLQIRVVRIRNLANGDLDLEHCAERIHTDQPRLVSVTHMPTNSGLIQDVEAVGQLCSTRKIPYLVDACQTVGQIPVDVQQIRCDFLTATGRKFLRGPRGTGFLYVSDRMLEEGYAPLFPDGMGATWIGPEEIHLDMSARRFETWERPYAMMTGLSEAMRLAFGLGIPDIMQYNRQLMHTLRTNLSAITGIEQYDLGSRKGNILTFRKTGKTLSRHQEILDAHHVSYSISTLPWALLDFQKKKIDWAIRFSPHYFNTREEMDQVAEIIETI